MDKATDIILSAHKIVVVGLWASCTAVYRLTHTLNIIKGNAALYRGGIGDSNYLLTETKEELLVIPSSFPRYMHETLQLVQAAQNRSIKISAISDDDLSPLSRPVNIFIKVIIPESGPLKEMVGFFTLLNVLVGVLIAKDNDHIRQQIDDYNVSTRKFYTLIN